MCGTNDERMSEKFCVSDSLARDASEMRKVKKYDCAYQKIAVHPETYCTVKQNQIACFLFCCYTADFSFSVNVSLRPAVMFPYMLRTQAQPNSYAAPC